MRRGWVLIFSLLISCRDQAAETTLNRAAGQVELDPAALDFGAVAIGSQKTRIISLTNSGRARLNICPPGSSDEQCSVASEISPDDETFEWPRPDMWWLVEPAETKKFTVLFAPKTAGEFSANITLGHDSGEAVQIPVTGSGVAPDLVFAPIDVDFSATHLQRTERRDLQVTNRSGVEVELQVTLSTGTPSAFSITRSALIIPAETSTTIGINYQPLEEQAHAGMVEARFCPNCLQQISLRGAGVKPLVRITPATLDFGSHDDETTPSLPIAIDSIGQSPLTITSVLLVAGSPREFEITPAATLPVTLAAGQSLQVQVAHRGDSPGVDVGRIEVRSDAWDDPATPEDESSIAIGLVAESLGPDIEVDATEINFGATRIGNFTERLVSISNRGNEPLTLSRVEVSGTATFSLDPPAVPLVMAPQAVTLIRLRHAPSTPGAEQGQLVIVSDDRDEGALAIALRGEGGVPMGCALSVAPLTATLGTVEPGRSKTIEIELKNQGSSDCAISELLLNNAGEITLSGGAPASLSISAGQTQRVSIEYSPLTYGVDSAELRFRSNDPYLNEAFVPLTGEGAAPAVRVLPGDVDLGTTAVGCRSGSGAVRLVAMRNTSITEVSLDRSSTRELEITPPALPLSLNTNGTATIEIRHRPGEAGEDRGILYIRHSGSTEPEVIRLRGRGVSSDQITDQLTLSPPTDVDVLFAVDNTSSTENERDDFAAAFQTFLTAAQGVSYQIAMTSADIRSQTTAGRFIEAAPSLARIITPQTPNAAQAFTANLAVTGNGTESAFEATYLALSDPHLTGFNANFARKNVPLHLVYFSDEDDQSAKDPDFYLRFLRDFKDQAPGQLSAHVIAGLVNGGCRGNGTSAGYAPRYVALAQATGGLPISFCAADWTPALNQLATAVFGPPRRMRLSAEPDPASIAVTLDGAVLPRTDTGGLEQWRYDPAIRALILSTTVVIPANATLQATYRAACL